jgi:hypothetical protein
MKKLLLATAVAIMAATAPLTAHADGPGYTGGCDISTVNDTTPDGTLGGQNVWNGEVDVLVVATTPGDSISASCWIKVGAGGTENKVLDATGPGVGFTAGAGRATFTAAATDTVFICTHVTTGSAGSSDVCDALTTSPICPDQVCGDGGLLDQAFAVLDTVFATVDGVLTTVDGVVTELTKIPDPVLCGQLKGIAGTIDSLPTSGVLYIDPASGDTYIGGTTADDLAWDCPPYVS